MRYRNPTRITGLIRSTARVGSPQMLVVPPMPLALRMTASIAADGSRL